MQTPQTIAEGWRYAETVVSGEKLAGELVKQACARALRDRKESEKEDYPYYYDEEAAQRVVTFFGFLKHLKGPLAGTPLYIGGWQIFIVSQLYGWKRKSDGYRRFRTCYIEVPRKSGKSTFCSGLGLYNLIADGEEAAEVYSAATTREQARIIFGDASHMVRKSVLAKKLTVHKTSITHLDSGSKFVPLSADANSLEGLSPSLSLVDELHVHKTSDVWDVLNVASGARSQPLIFAITTAGTNLAGICYETRGYGLKVLDSQVHDDTFFACVWTIDEGDDWRDPKTWEKANPGYGTSVQVDDLERLCKQAQESATAEVNFRTKRLNQWMNASQAWIKSADWEACVENTKPSISHFAGKSCYVGLDLAQVADLTAAVFLFEENGLLYPYGRYYLPEGAIQKATGTLGNLYTAWAHSDHVIVTPGDVTDLRYIEDDLCEAFGEYQIKEIAFDPYGAIQLTASMLDKGLPMVKMSQSIMSMTDPSKEFEKAVISGTLCPGDDPVMAFAASNCVIYIDPNSNIKVKKDHVDQKIDPVIASIMALGRLKVNGGLQPSVYSTRGIRSM